MNISPSNIFSSLIFFSGVAYNSTLPRPVYRKRKNISSLVVARGI